MNDQGYLDAKGHLTDEGLQWVDRYLKGELKGDELQQFKHKIVSDTAFASEVKMVHAGEAHTLEKLLETIQAEYEKGEAKIIKGRFGKRYLAAASIVLLISLVSLFFLNQKPRPEKLFAQNFTPYILASNNLRGADSDSVKQLYKKVTLAYRQGSFEEASGLFLSLLKDNPDNQNLAFYLGNCYLALDEPQQAIKAFKKILTSSEQNEFTSRSQWYLALAYLKNEDLNKAKDELQSIIEYDGYQKDKAEELLKDIAKL